MLRVWMKVGTCFSPSDTYSLVPAWSQRKFGYLRWLHSRIDFDRLCSFSFPYVLISALFIVLLKNESTMINHRISRRKNPIMSSRKLEIRRSFAFHSTWKCAVTFPDAHNIGRSGASILLGLIRWKCSMCVFRIISLTNIEYINV